MRERLVDDMLGARPNPAIPAVIIVAVEHQPGAWLQ